MSGATTSNRSRVSAPSRRLAPLVVTLALVVVALFAGPSPATGAGRRDAPATLDRAHHLAFDERVATSQTRDRRDAPVAMLPALDAAALIALAGTVVARRRRRTPAKPCVAFRRRAPPLLRTA